jgi:hypothetical protein
MQARIFCCSTCEEVKHIVKSGWAFLDPSGSILTFYVGIRGNTGTSGYQWTARLFFIGPTQVSALAFALPSLRQRGFQRVRPLAGGLQAWRNCGFPVSRDIQMLPASAPERAVYVLRELLHDSPTNSAQALRTSIANARTERYSGKLT